MKGSGTRCKSENVWDDKCIGEHGVRDGDDTSEGVSIRCLLPFCQEMMCIFSKGDKRNQYKQESEGWTNK